jgi:hypothetical protein
VRTRGTAIIEPKRETALIGAIVLEYLDLLVDCTAQKVVPRDPSGRSMRLNKPYESDHHQRRPRAD